MDFRVFRGMVPVLMIVFALGGCGQQQNDQSAEETDEANELREGYLLVHSVACQAKGVDGLLRLKKTSEANQALIRDIATTHQNICTFIESSIEQDQKKVLSQAGLPEFEQRSRQRMMRNMAFQLILSGKKESIKLLLLSQHFALGYEAGLLKLIANKDPSAERRQEAKKLSNDVKQLESRVLDRIVIQE